MGPVKLDLLSLIASVEKAGSRFKRMPIDCTIYSQIASVPVAELGLGGLVLVLVCAGRDVW